MTRGRAWAPTLVVATVLALGLLAAPAEAYVDPGTGSYVFQILLAGFLGSLVAVKSLWRRLRTYLAGRGHDSPPTDH